jgi:hypothetical protein
LGLAIISWSHYELNTRRKQTPLPLAKKSIAISSGPYHPLPEQVVIDVVEQVRQEQEWEKRDFSRGCRGGRHLTVRNRVANVWHGVSDYERPP